MSNPFQLRALWQQKMLISRDNALVLTKSVDHSSNMLNITNDKMFPELRALIDAQLQDIGLIPLVNEMEQARGTNGFAAIYNAFIQSAPNHMIVLAEVLIYFNKICPSLVPKPIFWLCIMKFILDV